MDAAPAIPPAAEAPVATAATCAPQPFRWSDLCGPDTGALKHLELTGDDSVWVTFGGEVRERVETIDHPELNAAGARGYTAADERFLLQADMRSAAGPRLFVQLAAAADDGRAVVRSFDRSAPDLQQGFVDLPFTVGGSSLLLRLGRQEVDLGDDRLVAVREPANLRLAFDMAMVQATGAFGRLIAFTGRPVINRPGAFDDRANPGESFSGLTAEWGTSASPLSGAVFGFYRDRRTAVVASAIGPDRRGTLGARIALREGPLDAKVQFVQQVGSAAGQRIDATGLTAEAGWTWRQAWGLPRASLVFGRASGDSDPHDGVAGDFDPLYPRLGYFTDAPVLYPRNVWDIAPTLRLSPARTVSLQAGAVFVVRLHRADALYGATSLPLPATAGAPDARVATLPYLTVRWMISPHVVADASAVRGLPGAGLGATDPRALTYGLAEIAYRF